METIRGKTSYGTISSSSGAGPIMESCDVIDPWAIVDLVDDSEKWTGRTNFSLSLIWQFKWCCAFILIDMTTKEKIFHLLGIGLKILGAIALLYFFICSLDLLANAFRLSSGKTAGKCFSFIN